MISEGNTFERVLGSLHAAALDDALWPAASALIDEACGAKGNNLVFGDGSGGDDIRIFLARFLYRGERREEWEREYFRDYYALDERVPRLRQLPDSRLVHVTELYTEEELKTSVVFNDPLARGHVQDSLNVRLDGPNNSRIVWVINDPVDGEGWSFGRVDLIRQLLPHLRHYLGVRQALAEAGALGESLAGLLDNTGSGVVQLDGRGGIVAANDPARDMLRQGDVLFDDQGFLGARLPADDDVLQRLLARALPPLGEQSSGGSMMVGADGNGPGLALHVSPLGEGEVDFHARHVAALVLITGAGWTRIDPDRVQAALGLTPTESRLAAWLAEGKTVRDIAALMDRSEHTVRWHLQQIFQKEGVSRQAELVRLVQSLAGSPQS